MVVVTGVQIKSSSGEQVLVNLLPWAACLPLQTSVSNSVKWVDNACIRRLLSGLMLGTKGPCSNSNQLPLSFGQEEHRTQNIRDILGDTEPAVHMEKKKRKCFGHLLHL